VLSEWSEWRVEPGPGGGGHLGNQEGWHSLNSEVETRDCWLGGIWGYTDRLGLENLDVELSLVEC
jgi:hypothetical protein